MTVEKALPSFPPPLTDPTQPAPLFARLRARCPVALVELPSGDRAWLVTRHEDNRRLFTDPRFSRAAAAAAGAPRVRPVPLEHRSIATLDPPEHTRIRRAALPWFTPAAARRQRPSIERTAGALLDRVVSGGPPADLVVGYAQPLALAVIGDLLGIPAQDRDRFRAWTDDYLGFTGASAAVVARAGAGLTSYMKALIASAPPAEGRSDGLLGGLSGAADRAGGLSDAEVVALAVTLAVAGYQTVANQIAASVVALLRDPGQWRLLCERGVRLVTAVEELLRYTPIAASGGTIRVATGDVTLSGVRVRAGEAVLPSTVSANRDGAVYRDPDRLDLSRNPNPHLAFGHGVHRCLGAHLARVELRVAIGVLLARLPRLRLAVPLAELPWQTDRMIRGPRTLPVVWD